MFVRYLYKGLFLLFLILIYRAEGQLPANTDLWLTGDPPPAFEKMVKKSGMQHFYVLPGKRGAENLVLWLREGEDFQNSVFRPDTLFDNEFLHSISPGGRPDIHKFGNVRGMGFAISYPFGEEGYHNFFLTSKELLGDTLYVHIAKAERLSHKCRSGHKKVMEGVKVKRYEEIPFQLERERLNYENFHLILQSGTELVFTALKMGKAVQEAEIEIISQEGWKKKMVTDQEGKISFRMVSDYFSTIQDIEKKHISRMLLKAHYLEEATGEYEGKAYSHVCYTSTMELEYMPTVYLYKSKAWSVFIVVLSLILLSVLVYFIFRKGRRRRLKFIGDGL